MSNTELYETSVSGLVDFVREHPHSGMSDHIRRLLVSIAFRIDMPLNTLVMMKSADDRRFRQLINVISLCRTEDWPHDIIEDDELRTWKEEVLNSVAAAKVKADEGGFDVDWG